MKSFAERRGITYPLLSDEGSRVIREFGILNPNYKPGTLAYGVPFPVTFLLDAKGRVRKKYFEEDFRERYSSANILIREFKEAGGSGQEIQAKHLKLRISASNTAIYVGSRVMLILEVVLPPKMHVYAPGVQGYKPIEWTMADSSGYITTKPEFPPAKKLHLKAIRETVPVYERSVRITRDLVAGQLAELKTVVSRDDTVTVKGAFHYQACDDKVCFAPEVVPLMWVFPVTPLDSVRAPQAVQKKLH